MREFSSFMRKVRRRRVLSIPDKVRIDYSGEPVVRAVTSRRTGPRPRSDQVLAIMRPPRLMGRSHTTSIGSARRAVAARRSRVPSGLLEPHLPFRNTSRPASVLEMPNVEAPGYVLRHRTRRVVGLS